MFSNPSVWLMRHLIMQVAEIIKEDLWPNPLKYFNNVRYLFPSL
jgi:hypothetical protein